MKRVTREQKAIVTNIICESFDQDPGMNYLVAQDSTRQIKIRNLVDHCFEVAFRSGEIYLSDDHKGAAMLTYPDSPLKFLETVKLDIKAVWGALGIINAFKALRRDALLKAKRPKKNIAYLWFLGVDPKYQGEGIGKSLLNEIINYSASMNKPLYLECSPHNLDWYKMMGFEVYDELNEAPFQYCMRTKL